MTKNSGDDLLKEKVVRGFVWQGGTGFVCQVITWLMTIFIIRLLSPGDYGLIAMATIFLEFLTMISELGFGAAVVQCPDFEGYRLRQLLSFILLINVLWGILTFWGAPLAASVFGEPRLITILKVLSINFLIMGFYVLPQSLLVRAFDFRKKGTVELFARVLSALTALILAFKGLNVWALVISLIVLHVAKLIGFNLVLPVLVWPKFSFQGLGRFLRFGSLMTGIRVLFFLHSQSDRALAGKFLGKDLLGIYSVALDLAAVPLDKVAPIIIQVTFPAFSRIQSDMDRVRRNVLRAVHLAALIFFPVFLGMAAVAPQFILFIFGDKWRGIVVPFQLVCVILPLKAFDPVISPAILGIGKPEVGLWNQAITFVVMAIAFVVGVKGGVTGLCIAWVVVYPLVFLLTTWRNLRALGIPFMQLVSAIRFSALSSAIMALGVIMIDRLLITNVSGALELGASIGAGILIYVLLAYRFQREVVTEIRGILRSS
jgi:O-antigen/teichoic acid export membrane protein